jgi:S1-C subfamily serine protease
LHPGKIWRFSMRKSLAHSVYKIGFLVGSAVAQSPEPSLAQTFSDELLPYAVHVERTPKQPWPGYGVYLGNGYVLTAAHVVGHAIITQPRIVIGGRPFPTEVIKEGTFETNDLTLLRVEPSLLPSQLQLRRIDLCRAPPIPGQPVVVVVPEGEAVSHILDPRLLPPDIRGRFPTDIADVESTGNSGSGVFDSRSGCLMGIMSRKIGSTQRNAFSFRTTRTELAKYFVPSTTISVFLPPTVHF